MKRVLLGVAGVDSGQLFIVDPCYVEDGLDYDVVCTSHTVGCDHTRDEPWRYMMEGTWEGEGLTFHHGVGGPVADGVVFSTGGDGAFGVYAEVDDYNNVLRVVIDLEGTDDEEAE